MHWLVIQSIVGGINWVGNVQVGNVLGGDCPGEDCAGGYFRISFQGEGVVVRKGIVLEPITICNNWNAWLYQKPSGNIFLMSMMVSVAKTIRRMLLNMYRMFTCTNYHWKWMNNISGHSNREIGPVNSILNSNQRDTYLTKTSHSHTTTIHIPRLTMLNVFHFYFMFHVDTLFMWILLQSAQCTIS